ncbi:MAG: hypothetical protein VYC80_18365 [Planctomycetota bacterium]|nr:hypothetical protein [Planctomycetota bacterium]
MDKPKVKILPNWKTKFVLLTRLTDVDPGSDTDCDLAFQLGLRSPLAIHLR